MHPAFNIAKIPTISSKDLSRQIPTISPFLILFFIKYLAS